MNLPKFVFEDVPLFLGLIKDLFPGLECPRVSYPDFNSAVEEALLSSGYILLPEQVSNSSLFLFYTEFFMDLCCLYITDHFLKFKQKKK